MSYATGAMIDFWLRVVDKRATVDELFAYRVGRLSIGSPFANEMDSLVDKAIACTMPLPKKPAKRAAKKKPAKKNKRSKR